ncbi:sensor histidine kinase [Gryllotalpicola ginsengisoli]|uniref:sensor histidine kinase n=1 Tax=Gryllotalpicola ginsengisoli TaxID=444608 RepID=UPI000416ABF3|nr:histidine kinase [Gryllotalpicola ginsengisoli]
MSARDRRLLPLALNGIGMAVVAYAFFSGPFPGRHGAWLTAAFVIALLAWAAVQLLPRGLASLEVPGPPVLRLVRRVVIFVGVAAAALAVPSTNGILLPPLGIVIVVAISDEFEPVWVGVAAALLSFALSPIGCLAAHSDAMAVWSYEAGNAVWLLIGVSRRQAHAATRQARALDARQRELREQEARAALMADRQAAARDVHDVLAHSLGGLVIQLDAAQALLESGRVTDAAAKVAQARTLAAEGLGDARRAVAALRSPDEPGTVERGPRDLGGAVERLLRAHRELGGRIDARVELGEPPAAVPAPVASAFERALQESLSNARRHAPGEPVRAELTAAGGRLALTVSNPMRLDSGGTRTAAGGTDTTSGATGTAGGGHGIAGMAERFRALPGGRAEAGPRDGEFVVHVEACLEEH